MLPEERELADKLIAQYASGRFGVSADYLKQGDAVEIKIGQGQNPEWVVTCLVKSNCRSFQNQKNPCRV